MADAAAHLVDRVLPDVPVRQWVLTLPFALRTRVAFDSELAVTLRNLFLATVREAYQDHARRSGLATTATGSVTVTQRFGSALNLNPHFHSLHVSAVCRGGIVEPLDVHGGQPEADRSIRSPKG